MSICLSIICFVHMQGLLQLCMTRLTDGQVGCDTITTVVGISRQAMRSMK